MSSSPDVSITSELTENADDHGETVVDEAVVNGGDSDALSDALSDDDIFDELETLSLSADTELDLYTCPSCNDEFKQPRVLSCLHVFCETCLKPLLVEDSIKCPTCNEPSEVESISELPLDYVIANGLDMKGIEGSNMICTSCKADETAISRCSDCANFLCPNCVTAHKFMRCFENHKVVSFEDITKGEGASIHRPIVCNLHGEEQPLKYFCNTCQLPICNECMINDHQNPGHRIERITEIENREQAIMRRLIEESEAKVKKCEESSNNLHKSLTDLESQRDDAKSLIKETFQSYKSTLEERQESILSQLDELHKQQELSVMEMFNKVDTTVGKIERGRTFVRRIVEKSNTLELLSLKKVMSQFMSGLLEQSLGDSVSVDIKFVSDKPTFDKAVTDHFGHFTLRDESVVRNSKHQQQLQQQRQMERQVSRANIASSEGGVYNNMPSPPTLMSTGSYVDMSHMPAGPPMLGSPDSGLCNDQNLRPILANDFMSNANFLPANNGHTMSDQLGLRNASVTSLSGGTGTMHDLQAVLPASQSRQSQSPTVSDSGIGMDSNSPGIQTGQTLPFTLLAKMGAGGLGYSTHSETMLNNHLGMNINDKYELNNAATGGNSIIGRGGGGGPNMTMSSTSSPDHDLQLSHGSGGGMFSPTGSMSGGRIMSNSSGVDNALLQRRESMPMGMPSGAGGGGSGFTSPVPSQFNTGASPFPLRNKMSAMQIRHKFGSLGPSKVQFNSPHGFCMGFDEDIVVADTNNHRIQVFDKSGDFKYQFGIPGREEGQLWYPRKVAVMRGTSRYVICDRGNERSRMQIFSKNGHFVKKIAIRYIDIVAGLAITPAGNIVAVDSVSPTVFTIAESGDLIKWFDCSDYMREPSDIAVADKEYYVCDFKGHCVVVFNDDGQFQRRIGTDTITNFPNGIDISDAGDVLVGDSHGNRFHVAVFQRDGSLIGEFECPYVKVSRCCGLKITSEGYVVTLAKNNHHVLVLNTLYIS